MAITQQFYQVRSDSVVIYDLVMEHHGRRHLLPMPGAATYSGKVTNHARRRLLKALDLLVQKSPQQRVKNHVSGNWHDFRLGFITLTIADQKNVTAEEAYKSCLREWLRHMKRKHAMTDYVWKAELQKRGQVHYHVATNAYIPWETVRWRWNQLQYRAGYLESFRRKYRHINPNSTDVHSIVKTDECFRYIGKELCKGIQNQKATVGKIWDCAAHLKGERFSAPTHAEFLARVDDAIQHGFAEVIEAERCHIVKCERPLELLTPHELAQYQAFISSPIP